MYNKIRFHFPPKNKKISCNVNATHWVAMLASLLYNAKKLTHAQIHKIETDSIKFEW